MKLCNLETAKALQKLGYDGYYNYIYAKNTESSLRYIGFKEVFELSEYTGPPAPRLDDAAYWLRDNYKLNIVISIADGNLNYYHLTIEDFSGTKYDGDFVGSYSDPTDALEVGVKRCLEIIKQRIN